MKKRLYIIGSIGISFFIVLLVFLILIAKNKGLELPIDTSIKELAYKTRGNKGNFVYYFFRIITEFGDKYAVILLLGLALLYTKLDKRFIMFFLAVALAAGFNTVLKEIYSRTRPDEAMQWMEDSLKSFPSGHSAATGAMYSFIIYNFIVSKDNKKLKLGMIIPSAILLILIPSSRIVLGMHYISDVIAGISLGVFFGCLAMVGNELLGYYNILPEGVIPFKKKPKNDEVKNEDLDNKSE